MKRRYLFLSILIFCISLVFNNKGNKSNNIKNCLIVHGGGITGFWNTLGKLKKIDLDTFSEVYCYSSGCFALIIKINNYRDLNKVINKSLEIKEEIYSNYNYFYHIRRNFTDFLIDNYHQINYNASLSIISSNIFNHCSLNKYNLYNFNKSNLKEMILDSTFIPAITGFYNEDRLSYDGSFCQFNLPNCIYNLHPSLNIFNLRNMFNFDLSKKEIDNLLNDNL